MSIQPEEQQAANLPSVSDFLSSTGGGGAPAVKFPSIGASFTGVVTAERLDQTRVYVGPGKVGPLEFWDDGRPKLQLVLTLAEAGTGEEHRMFLKSGLLKAAKEALAPTGLTSFVGGTLKVTHTGVAKTRAKEYDVEFAAPEAGMNDAAIDALRQAGLTN